MRTGSIPKGLLHEPPDVAEFGLEDFVTFRLLVLARALDRQAKRSYGESFGLSLVEWRIMAMIGMIGKATVNRLAQRMDYDKAQISRAVAGLVKSGYLRRARNAQDTRSANLVLTPRGGELHAELIAFGRERQRALLAALSPTERRQLYDIMGVLMKHLAHQEASTEAKTRPEPA
jgi:DNA-binding MarR family transcriptional regulator